jgi:hypothetical protein
MVDELISEEIPNSDSVFMRAHRSYFRDGKLEHGVFKAKDGPGMSVDWEKYSSAEDTRQRARNPRDNAVLALSASGIRSIEGLDVRHVPEPQNRSHSEVNLPDKDTKREELIKVRFFLHRIAEIIIPVGI